MDPDWNQRTLLAIVWLAGGLILIALGVFVIADAANELLRLRASKPGMVADSGEQFLRGALGAAVMMGGIGCLAHGVRLQVR